MIWLVKIAKALLFAVARLSVVNLARKAAINSYGGLFGRHGPDHLLGRSVICESNEDS